ncbi:MAG: histidine phosphatase family protein [Caulobacterales bacterium 32-69-10]|nr:MAG: histidine phosphatase family protein [Caulobacterales bacterium 32-69-10]
MSDPTAPDTTSSSAAPGWILLARHGEPALSRKIRLNAAEYRAWWDRYEAGGLLADQVPPPALVEMAGKADTVMVSSRRRAIETAHALVQGKAFDPDVRMIEAPLPAPPLPDFLRFNPKVWGFISRFCWWFFDYHDAGQENRSGAVARARDLAQRLIDEAQAGRNVIAVAHGFFNFLVALQLKSLGWRQVEGRGHRYWSTKLFKR